MNFFPVKTTVVKHSVRDITFILPQPDPEVGYLAANYEKRLQTAKKWASEKFFDQKIRDWVYPEVKEFVELDNNPLHGYVVETLNGRYRTEVEYICMRHPQGYVFEVPFQNLLDIIKEVGCGVGGVISAECRMFAVGGKWRVIPVGGAMEIEALALDKESRKFIADKKKNASKKFVKGQVVKMRDTDGYWVYVGKHKIGAYGSIRHEGFTETYGYGAGKSEISSTTYCHSVFSGSRMDVATRRVDPKSKQEYVDSLHLDFKDLEATYMVFVRLPKISKTESISNEDFMSRGYRKGKPQPEMMIFKGKSVQFQPTDEFDKETLENALGGGVEYEVLGAIPQWQLLHNWDEHIRYRNGYGFSGAYFYQLKKDAEPVLGEVFGIIGGERAYLSSIDRRTKRIYGVNDISKPEMRELVKFKIEK